MDPFCRFSFFPSHEVLNNWYIKGYGMCYPVRASRLLVKKSIYECLTSDNQWLINQYALVVLNHRTNTFIVFFLLEWHLTFFSFSFSTLVTEKPDETGRLLVEFLKSVVDDIKSVEPSIVTFALSLCGIVVKDSSFYTTHHTLVSRLYHTVHKQRLTTDPSIGTEYFKSLTVVCQNLKWISFEDCTQGKLCY